MWSLTSRKLAVSMVEQSMSSFPVISAEQTPSSDR